MQIVIELREDTYEAIKRIGSGAPAYIDRAILGGVILPKGHGRLIDADEFLNELYQFCDDCGTLAENPYRDNPHIDSIVDILENSHTIIPADREVSE